MASDVVVGTLARLRVRYGDPVEYALPVGESAVPLDPLIDRAVRIRFEGTIACVHCGRATRKSFSQGYCFTCAPCRAACDIGIVEPEWCQFAAGPCREPEWVRTHCPVPHVVHLATMGIKGQYLILDAGVITIRKYAGYRGSVTA